MLSSRSRAPAQRNIDTNCHQLPPTVTNCRRCSPSGRGRLRSVTEPCAGWWWGAWVLVSERWVLRDWLGVATNCCQLPLTAPNSRSRAPSQQSRAPCAGHWGAWKEGGTLGDGLVLLPPRTTDCLPPTATNCLPKEPPTALTGEHMRSASLCHQLPATNCH